LSFLKCGGTRSRSKGRKGRLAAGKGNKERGRSAKTLESRFQNRRRTQGVATWGGEGWDRNQTNKGNCRGETKGKGWGERGAKRGGSIYYNTKSGRKDR